jgi:hypothetical protein
MEKFVKAVSAGAGMLILNLELPPGEIVEGEKDLFAEILAPSLMIRTCAEAGSPFVIPWSVINDPAGIVLVKVPPLASCGAVTWKETVQVPGVEGVPAGTLPLARVTVLGKVTDTVPPQVVVADPGTTVSTSPGRVSDNCTPVYAAPVGLRNVIVRVVISPARKLDGENVLDNPISCTLRVAEAGDPLVTPC